MKKTAFFDGWTCNGVQVRLPHDAMIAEGTDPSAPSGSGGGYYKGGQYRYENCFDWDGESRLIFEFEGVYHHARVYLNDILTASVENGYRDFFAEATPYLKPGENSITVTCDNTDQPNSRWYSGSGIYRPVWLHTGPQNAILPDSVRISTVSINPAVIHICSPSPVRAEVEGICGEGTDFTITIPNARLWSAETPELYMVRITNGEDSAEIPLGIRVLSWSEQGLFVNGQRTLLRGCCLHHNNGILGARSYREAEFRKVALLKQYGFNAIRSAHNPCSKYLLEACDVLGMYVMDEGWDMWFMRKTKYDYGTHFRSGWQDDAAAMVTKDFNHPCVLMYSIGNEVTEPVFDGGLELERELVEFFHAADPTRPVTAGFNPTQMANARKQGKNQLNEEGEKAEPVNSSMMFNMMASVIGTGMNKSAGDDKIDELLTPAIDMLDIVGYNYASGKYRKDQKRHPQRIMLGSETFPQDIAKNWALVKEIPQLLGDFMWTGVDYLGEVGIGAWAYTEDGRSFTKPWPWKLGDVGALDILGNPTGEAFLADAVWSEKASVRIAVQPVNHPGVKLAKQTWRGTNAIPCWSWQGCEGNKAVVEVYANAESVALYLNGRRVRKKRVKDCAALFRLRYRPGRLSAVAFDKAGREIGRCELQSAGTTLRPRAIPEKRCTDDELVFYHIVIADEHGTVDGNTDRKIRVEVEGGELLALGSANPRTQENYNTDSCTTYYGRALAVVRKTDEKDPVFKVCEVKV